MVVGTPRNQNIEVESSVAARHKCLRLSTTLLLYWFSGTQAISSSQLSDSVVLEYLDLLPEFRWRK